MEKIYTQIYQQCMYAIFGSKKVIFCARQRNFKCTYISCVCVCVRIEWLWQKRVRLMAVMYIGLIIITVTNSNSNRSIFVRYGLFANSHTLWHNNGSVKWCDCILSFIPCDLNIGPCIFMPRIDFAFSCYFLVCSLSHSLVYAFDSAVSVYIY